ncbi:hypothetical protein FEZ18_05235 [Oceanihabitans sp. IOP_32]|uniref:hypothetical protein n=1 Tax=Oceanihabitans sp. IOP_32 TaxID=2529032 RepID=UPI0012939259|nr:hypothetical protein [Oceanihabitans sp. IOP_32]QFZ54236.1 hypothetical protein FEZ18_05235 [Oceanihabitans sp. IOP_32]
MRILIYTILFLTFSQSFSQKTLSFENILAELEKSSESLNTTLISPKSDFYIGITKDAIVENPELNSCIDIETNEKKNEQIIGILKKHNLLDKLYVEIENEYSDLSSDKIFKPTETELYLELFFKTKGFGIMSCFVPVFEKKKAKELICDLDKIFDYKYCFKKLKRKI